MAADPARPPIVAVSHLAVYAADPGASERFYVDQLGATKQPDPEDPRGARYHFSASQFVEVLPLPAGAASINRLAHAAFITPDAEGLRRYLKARGAGVPAKLARGADGSRWFDVRDPEGLAVQFVQPGPDAPAPSARAASDRMIHVGFIVHDRGREDRFWRDLLGFRPYWSGGVNPAKPTWISLQVPEGSDWLEYMVVGTPAETGIPAGMSQANLGILNHFALGVRDIRETYTGLWTAKRLEGQKADAVPKIGLDAKWQLNLIDPDGTRAEFMEFAPVGEPCCSPFAAAHPHP
ncbi:VOC family protein [Sphingomonas sp.]|uniref:VOC family protein n=1 Tax=Sphingomonas sp. TaxID=28214 RepID=UPI003B3B306B